MKTVVITGSTRGIGLGLAESFLQRGCQVAISGRQQHQVDATVASLGEQFGHDNVTGCACEITAEADLQALWDHTQQQFGRVDIWINNAGISITRQLLADTPAADINAIVNINLGGMLLANKIALRGMRAQGHGQIWNMEGFGSGGQTQPGMACYGATKRGVNYLIKALQKEVKGSAVQVCTLSPGMVVTDLLIGDYDLQSAEWAKARRIFNILGDKVETVTPWLAERILASNKSGATVAWLTNSKAMWRFLTAAFNKRDLFADIDGA